MVTALAAAALPFLGTAATGSGGGMTGLVLVSGPCFRGLPSSNEISTY